MKKKLFSVLLAVLLLCACAVFASAEHAHIYDDTDLISTENESKCETICEKIEETYGFCVVFCLPYGIDGQIYVSDYCADVYASRVNSEKALICTHDLESNLCGYYAVGDDTCIFTQEVIDELFGLYNAADTYASGMEMFLNGVADKLGASDAFADLTTQVVADSESVTVGETVAQPVSAYVSDGLPLVVDKADLLTDAQEDALEEQLYALSSANDVDIVVLTVASLNGKSSLAYADDYFDYNGYGQGEDRSGMLLLYKPGPAGERDIALSTRGTLFDCVSDADSDAMLDTLIPYLIEEDYAAAFDEFVVFAERETAEIGKVQTLPLIYIPACLLFGFVAAFIIMKIRTSSLKSVRKAADARFYIRQGSLVLTGSNDLFLYKNVTKTPKQTQSSGASGRTSSSGATHGGTSRKF